MAETINVQKIGRYILQQKLGEGSMGSVWLSFHTGLNIPVAIKLLNTELASEDPEYLSRFMQEGRLAGQLNHKNIVRIFDAGKEGKFAYIVMEYIEGCDTLELLEARGALPADEVLGLAIGVAEALQEAHSLGIIHRDIKPDNILATNEGRIKLADLGLAKQVNDDFGSTIAGVALGTPYYISPEQALDALQADARSDIYSFGATLYHLLSGFLPYEGDNVMGVMLRHTNEALTPPQDKNPDIPISFCNVICKMMEKNPDHRYQNCAELLDDLLKLKYGRTDVAISSGQDEAKLRADLAAGKSVRVKVKIPNKGKYTHSSKQRPSSSGKRKSRASKSTKKSRSKSKSNRGLYIGLASIAALLLFMVPLMLRGDKKVVVNKPQINSNTVKTKEVSEIDLPKTTVSKKEEVDIVEDSIINLLEGDGSKHFVKTHDCFNFEDGKLIIDSGDPEKFVKQRMPTKERYTKFKLTTEFMFLTESSDSGIHFHAHDDQFCEIQLGIDVKPKAGTFLSRKGAYYTLNGIQKQHAFMSSMPQKGVGEWNTLVMNVNGDELKYNLNGVRKVVSNLSVSEGYIRITCWGTCKMVIRKLELEKLD